MEFNNEEFLKEMDNRSKNEETEKPQAWRIEDDKDLTEKGLEKSFTGANDKLPVTEGAPAGGQNFGKSNNTSAANDKNNPSQYAGNTNPYFNRTEPSEEHPENNNFKVKDQEGSPDYDKAQPYSSATDPDPKPEKDNGDNENNHQNDDFNNPGPEELPDQQKVGEDVDDETFKRDHDHIET